MRCFLCFVLFTSLLSTGVFASPQSKAREYSQAVRKLQQEVFLAQRNGTEPPRLSDRKWAKTILLLSDRKRFVDTQSYQLKDMNALMTICGESQKAAMAYALYDLQGQRAKGVQINGQKAMLQFMQKNIIRFQDELRHIQPFSLVCLAKQMPLMEQFVKRLSPEQLTPTRMSGLYQMRDGVYKIYSGLLGDLNNPSLSKRYRFTLLKVLAETSQAFAAILPPKRRKVISKWASSKKSYSPAEFQGYIDNIVNVFNSPKCVALCKL